jgi:hypothetical protein
LILLSGGGGGGEVKNGNDRGMVIGLDPGRNLGVTHVDGLGKLEPWRMVGSGPAVCHTG